MANSQPMSADPSANLAGTGQSGQPASDGRWVVFEYCVSLIAVTLRRPSRPIYLKLGKPAWIRSLPYVCISILFGWWGLPWGVILTPVTIFANLTGGCDITAQVRASGGPHE